MTEKTQKVVDAIVDIAEDINDVCIHEKGFYRQQFIEMLCEKLDIMFNSKESEFAEPYYSQNFEWKESKEGMNLPEGLYLCKWEGVDKEDVTIKILNWQDGEWKDKSGECDIFVTHFKIID